MTCNYCKKPGHIKIECRALKAKNGKFMQKGSCTEELNFCGSSSMTLRITIAYTPKDDPNILNVESTTEVEVLLTTEEATSWLLDSSASYLVTLFRTQFRSYMARNFDPVRVGNLQHCAVIGIGTVELKLRAALRLYSTIFDTYWSSQGRSFWWDNSTKRLFVPASRKEGGVSTKGTSCLLVV
jgi:hypothetical protein